MSSTTSNETLEFMYLTHPSCTGCCIDEDGSTDTDKENLSTCTAQEQNKSSNDGGMSQKGHQTIRVFDDRLDSAFQAVAMRWSGPDLARTLAAEYIEKLSC